MSFVGFSTSLFGWIVDKYPNIFPHLKDSLPKADIKIPFRSYVSLCFMLSILAYGFSLGLILGLLNYFKFPPLLQLLYTTFVPIGITLGVFAFILFYPIQKAHSRRADIEVNLPFVLTHMGAISESGVPPYIIFKLISEFKEYGEIAKEMKKIVVGIDTFGLDPITAMRNVARKTPSDKLREILEGIITTTEAGGNITVYLKTIGEQTLFEWRAKREKFIRQLSTFAEIYTGLLIAAPIFIISLFAVLSIIQPRIGGLSILDLTKLSVYGLIPVINLAFLAVLKTVEVEM